MLVLIAYASTHGATRGIAERIAERCEAAGLNAHAQRVTTVTAIEVYDAFVVGSAAYLGRWQPEATEFVTRHQAILAERPTWLFSSGPLRRDVPGAWRDTDRGEPAEVAQFRALLRPRGHRTFPGALQPRRLRLREHAHRLSPAARRQLVAGDFRDWAEIGAWAGEIATALTRHHEPFSVG